MKIKNYRRVFGRNFLIIFLLVAQALFVALCFFKLYAQTLEIGTDKSGVFFTDDPTEIANEVNDTFDVLLRQSATIRLQCRNLIGDFFCKSCRDAVVNIYKNDKCVFAGFIEPQCCSKI